MNKRDRAIEFLRLVAAGQVREAWQRHVGAGLVHHNPYFAAHEEALIAAMEADAAANPAKTLEVQRALQDGDEVAVHSWLRQHPDDPGHALVHLFRFEADRIVELWDLAQEVPESSPNAHGMF